MPSPRRVSLALVLALVCACEARVWDVFTDGLALRQPLATALQSAQPGDTIQCWPMVGPGYVAANATQPYPPPGDLNSTARIACAPLFPNVTLETVWLNFTSLSLVSGSFVPPGVTLQSKCTDAPTQVRPAVPSTATAYQRYAYCTLFELQANSTLRGFELANADCIATAPARAEYPALLDVVGVGVTVEDVVACDSPVLLRATRPLSTSPCTTVYNCGLYGTRVDCTTPLRNVSGLVMSGTAFATCGQGSVTYDAESLATVDHTTGNVTLEAPCFVYPSAGQDVSVCVNATAFASPLLLASGAHLQMDMLPCPPLGTAGGNNGAVMPIIIGAFSLVLLGIAVLFARATAHRIRAGRRVIA